MSRTVEPYRLSEGPHLFVDWRYVQAGHVRWVSKENTSLSLWGTEGPVEAYPSPQSVPRGIRIVAQKAQKSEPFLTCTEPWEHMLYCYSTIMRDEGRYRLWYEVVTPERSDVLCYAESKDGIAWNKPPLGIVAYQGKDTNIVFGGTLCSETGFHGCGVFLDVSAPPNERYKMIFLGSASKQTLENLARTRPETVNPVSLIQLKETAREKFGAIYGAFSPDGIHWKAITTPLTVHESDTEQAAYYDPALEKYVWFCRMWRYGRRCIGRSETKDFHVWPAPEILIWPETGLPASDDWYTNSHCVYPGTVDYHFMFPALYQRNIDSAELHIFSSSDGIAWSQVPGGPILSPEAPGSWDCGYLFGGVGLVPLPNNRVGLPYMGFPVPHKYPRSQRMGAISYAWWPEGRLAALEASEDGEFSTQQFIVPGRRLFLNVQTLKAGNVLVEVADKQGQALPGRSFGECDPVYGDHFGIPVTWKGEADIETRQPIVLRFRMRAAKLFAFEFK